MSDIDVQEQAQEQIDQGVLAQEPEPGPTAEDVVKLAADRGFQLGNTVEDSVTGLRGIATAYHDTLGRISQASVQPKSKDGITMPDAFFIDVNHLTKVDDGVAGTVNVQPPVPTTIRLGMHVNDMVTMFEGIVVGRVVSMNGCIDFSVQGALGEDGKMLRPMLLSSKRLLPSKTVAKLADLKNAIDGPEMVDSMKALDEGDKQAIANTQLTEEKTTIGSTLGTGACSVRVSSFYAD